MRTLYVGTLGNADIGPVFLDAECVFDVATGKSLAELISEMETLKEAITIFFRGPIKASGNHYCPAKISNFLFLHTKKIRKNGHVRYIYISL